jgi:hypothetical protein
MSAAGTSMVTMAAVVSVSSEPVEEAISVRDRWCPVVV